MCGPFFVGLTGLWPFFVGPEHDADKLVMFGPNKKGAQVCRRHVRAQVLGRMQPTLERPCFDGRTGSQAL